MNFEGGEIFSAAPKGVKKTFWGVSKWLQKTFTEYQAQDIFLDPLVALIPNIPFSPVPKFGVRVPSCAVSVQV